jgi:cytochrome c peroxidase
VNKNTATKQLLGVLMLFSALIGTTSFSQNNENVIKDADGDSVVLEPGHPSLKKWLLPEKPPAPDDNQPSLERIALGKKLFFDPRLSRDGNQSCGTCHNPSFGWAEPIAKSLGFQNKMMARNSQSLVNSAYNLALLWDGRKDTLDEQAIGPVGAPDIMNADFEKLLPFLKENSVYKKAFEQAYPGQPITKPLISKALASFERTIIVKNTPFDRWIGGDSQALTPQEIRGFRVFIDPDKGSCASCHAAPNFTDNGFHNIGLSSFGDKEADIGRFKHKKVKVLKGAFKTPSLRNVSRTAPYFHDGSAPDLMHVIEHYVKGGVVKENISKQMKPLNLSDAEQKDLVAFLKALTAPYQPVELPNLTED